MRLAVDLHYNCVARNRLQLPDKTPPAVQSHLQFGEDAGTQKTLEVRARPQDPIEPGRGHLESVMTLDGVFLGCFLVGSSRVDLQACKLEYSIVSPK